MIDSFKWVYNNGIGYFFPKGGVLNLTNKYKKGNWTTINNGYVADAPIEGKVFSLSMQHGSDDDKYAYIVLPGFHQKDLEDYPAKGDVRILVNSDSLQVVNHSGLGIYGFVFYYPGCYEDENLSLIVNHPSVIMIKNYHSERMEIYGADPTQSQSLIEVGVKTGHLAKQENIIFDFSEIDKEMAGITIRKDVKQSVSTKLVMPSINASNRFYVAHAGVPFDIASLKDDDTSIVNVYDIRGRQLFFTHLESGRTSLLIRQKGIYLMKKGKEIHRIIVK